MLSKTLKLGSLVLVGVLITLSVSFGITDTGSEQKTTIPTPKLIETSKIDHVVYNKSILRLNIPATQVVYLDTEVNALSVDKAITQLKALDANPNKGPAYLLINSPGGEVIKGMELISQIESMKVPVYTVCTGMCASMAAFIHQYGVKRYALDRSFLMFHPASSGGMGGQLPNILSRIGAVQRSINKMFAYVAFKSHKRYEEMQLKVAYEDWIDAEDSLGENLIDAIVSLPTVCNEDPSKSVDLSGLLPRNK